jgi:multidrug efflux system membrane fusion protein
VPQVMERVHSGAQLPVTAFDRANVTQLAVGQLGAVDTQVNSTTGTVMLRANFDNADERLFPSQFVNVVMLLDTLKNAVRVPARAVQRGAPGSYVYLVDAQNTVAVHPIKLGEQDGDFFAVASGLSPGDVVVTDGADRLRDGAKVSIPNPSATPATPAAPNGPRVHGHWQGQGSGAGGHGTGQHHHRPGSEDQPPSGEPPAPGQPPAQVKPQPPAQPPPAPASSPNPS